MSWWPTCLLLAVSALTAPATAAARDTGVKLLVVSGKRGELPDDRPALALLGQQVHLFGVIRVRRRGRRTLYYSAARAFRLGERRIAGRRVRPLGESPVTRFQWYQVEPRPHHVDVPPPNRGNPAYSNAILFGPRHGKWLGYDTIEYHETAISGATDGQLIVTRTEPSHPRVDVNGGLGTMRYKLVAQVDGALVESRGAEAVGRGGISPRVPRVTFRSGDRFIDHLRGYFNVPNVFGSGGRGRRHQAELYQGADCADVIVGAIRAAGARIPYTSAAGLKGYTKGIAGRLLMRPDGLYEVEDGKPGHEVSLSFGADVQVGDIVLIDYANFTGSPRRWDHIAVISADEGQHGILDPDDLLLHMGYLYGLTEEAASEESPAYIEIRRLKPRIQRAMRWFRRGRRGVDR